MKMTETSEVLQLREEVKILRNKIEDLTKENFSLLNILGKTVNNPNPNFASEPGAYHLENVQPNKDYIPSNLDCSYKTADYVTPSYHGQMPESLLINQNNVGVHNDMLYHSYHTGKYEQHYNNEDTAADMSMNHMHTKTAVRNSSELIKRCRSQSTYELSQDLLDKQIELLERKYGGLKARNAAIIIQRAFRHFMMVKKFASITAMAKTEKRLSRTRVSTSPINKSQIPITNDKIDANYICPSSNRIPPSRSLSLRESRQLETHQSPPSVSVVSPVNRWHTPINSMVPIEQKQHYYKIQYLPYQNPQQMLIPQSIAAKHGFYHENIQMDGSQSSMCGYPQTTYYTASQIYMRPRTLQSQCPGNKKVPPEVPKRTSSIHTIQQQQGYNKHCRQVNGLTKSPHIGSMTSVQSSGSDSSLTSDRLNNSFDVINLSGTDRSDSPKNWKHYSNSSQSNSSLQNSAKNDSLSSKHQVTILNNMQHMNTADESSHNSQFESNEQIEHYPSGFFQSPHNFKISETLRKRQYRVGLNLFNKKPEKGVTYLMKKGFLDSTPQAVAKFLITRKGLSRQMIGEYLGNLQSQFNMAVLEFFAMELDLSGMAVDVALRKFQTFFRMPGEAQKIERLMEIFSSRYCHCNPDMIRRLRSTDTIFVLAFAIIMLNTDLHTPNLKQERKMKVEDFIKNLRGIDDCYDIEKDILIGIYDRVKNNEFKPGSDHVTQVMKVQATIVGKKPNLALPHRRLVCYCRLYEISDLTKKERPGVHQREVFLFNDVLVITKIFSKKKSSVTYTFRNSYSLCGMSVNLLDVSLYSYCIQLSQKVDNKILVTFNARNEHDRCKFAEDLKEAISEMDEMESLRIETELERQKANRNRSATGEHRDSGVADVEVVVPPIVPNMTNSSENNSALKRSALSNSLLDMHDQFGIDKPQRRGSVGSLDSGMSISFQNHNENQNKRLIMLQNIRSTHGKESSEERRSTEV